MSKSRKGTTSSKIVFRLPARSNNRTNVLLNMSLEQAPPMPAQEPISPDDQSARPEPVVSQSAATVTAAMGHTASNISSSTRPVESRLSGTGSRHLGYDSQARDTDRHDRLAYDDSDYQRDDSGRDDRRSDYRRDDRHDGRSEYGRNIRDDYRRDDRRSDYRRDDRRDTYRRDDRDDSRRGSPSYRRDTYSTRRYDDEPRDSHRRSRRDDRSGRDRSADRRRSSDDTHRRDHASPPRKRDKSAGKARAVSEVKVEIFQTFKNSMKESMTVPVSPADNSPSPITTPAASKELSQAASSHGSSPPEPEERPWLSGCVEQFIDRQEIGQGTYGKVYRATNAADQSKAALKMIKMENEREGFPLTALREIKILRQLHHPAIVNLMGIVVDVKRNKELLTKSPASFYLVFEYMEHDLAGLLESGLVTLDLEQVRSLMKQLVQGVEYCHAKGFLHRDIKGSNLLVSNRCELKIADFGLARRYEKTRDRGYTNKVITLWYRPPELLLGAIKYGPAVDVWSAGCILGELFIRRPMFRGSNEIEQLLLVCQCCGTPSTTSWAGYDTLPAYDTVMPKRRHERNLVKFFADKELALPAPALDLLDQMLALNPNKRLTASQCLEHPYLKPPSTARPLDLARDQDCHEMWSKAQRRQNAAASQ